VPLGALDAPADPVTVDATQAEALFLQLDPLLCISKVRALARRIVQNQTQNLPITHLAECAPKALAECTVTTQNLEIMAQGEHFMQGQSIFNPKDPEEMTSDILEALQEHVFRGESRWHYLNMALFPAVMTRKPVILGDIPDPVHRCMVANAVSVTQMRDMFAHVVSVLQHHYQHSSELLTPNEAFLDLYPHILSPPRDLYLASMLRWTASVHSSVSAWVGVQHAGPITDLFETAPDLATVMKIPDPKQEESNADLLNQPYLLGPYPYLAVASASPEEWVKWQRHYEEQLEAVEVPEELARQVQEAIGKTS
jgi:hypothetical protein